MSLQHDVRIATLADAYAVANYRWELGGRWHALRLGQPAPELEAQYPQAAVFGLLSAWDPHSIPRAETVNRSADEALHTVLLASGLPYRAGFSSAANRSWREPSWVVAGMPLEELDRLALRFGQLGTLGWLRGEPVRLRMYARQPLLAHGREFVDWIEAATPPARDPRRADSSAEG